MSTEVMGVLGFILALAVLVVLVCKGMHLAYCAVITVLIITVTNGMPLMETLSNYWGTVGGIASMFLPIFLFGAIFAKGLHKLWCSIIINKCFYGSFMQKS